MRSLSLVVLLFVVPSSLSLAATPRFGGGAKSVESAASTPDASSLPSSSSSSRRGFLSTVGSTGVSSLVLPTILGGWGTLASPALAVGGLGKVNDKLRSFGLPVYTSVPDGLTPLCEIYGKGRNRFPLLVTFAHPLTWVVTVPSNDANGEDGTIQAGEYAKGDTATLFVYNAAGHVDDLHSAPKSLIEQTLIKAISQKGDNMYQVRHVGRVLGSATPVSPTSRPFFELVRIAHCLHCLVSFCDRTSR